MDRRQQKTRTAIFQAFTSLLTKKNYHNITVQNIIDAANVGRTTFYDHFEAKDDLLKSLCDELFGHVISKAANASPSAGLSWNTDAESSVFCHLLQHLQKNSNQILVLLSCESNELFLKYFRESLGELVQNQLAMQSQNAVLPVSQDFLQNHITGSFVEMVLWWIRGHMVQTPEELSRSFHAVIDPIFQSPGGEERCPVVSQN